MTAEMQARARLASHTRVEPAPVVAGAGVVAAPPAGGQVGAQRWVAVAATTLPLQSLQAYTPHGCTHTHKTLCYPHMQLSTIARHCLQHEHAHRLRNMLCAPHTASLSSPEDKRADWSIRDARASGDLAVEQRAGNAAEQHRRLHAQHTQVLQRRVA